MSPVSARSRSRSPPPPKAVEDEYEDEERGTQNSWSTNDESLDEDNGHEELSHSPLSSSSPLVLINHYTIALLFVSLVTACTLFLVLSAVSSPSFLIQCTTNTYSSATNTYSTSTIPLFNLIANSLPLFLFASSFSLRVPFAFYTSLFDSSAGRTVSATRRALTSATLLLMTCIVFGVVSVNMLVPAIGCSLASSVALRGFKMRRGRFPIFLAIGFQVYSVFPLAISLFSNSTTDGSSYPAWNIAIIVFYFTHETITKLLPGTSLYQYEALATTVVELAACWLWLIQIAW